MKTTNIVRHMDELGRIVIPKVVREQLRIMEDDAFEINYTHSGDIILRKYRKSWEQTVKEWFEKNIYTMNRCTFQHHHDYTICFTRLNKKERCGVAKRMESDTPDLVIGKVAAYARAVGTPIDELVGWKG